MYTVFYKRDSYNPYRTYFQNANRFVGSKSFANIEEAKEFANTVSEPRVYGPTGKKITI